MLCSARELAFRRTTRGLLVLEPDAAVGRDVRELSRSTHVPHAQAHPNQWATACRCWASRADVAALAGAAFNFPVAPRCTPMSRMRARSASHRAACCGRYFGTRRARPHPRARTPAWMVRSLERAGLRAISPLVEHHQLRDARARPADDAFARTSSSARRCALHQAGREPHPPEAQHVSMRALLAIADDSGPVALGGVMGGQDSMWGRHDQRLLRSGVLRSRSDPGQRAPAGLTSDAAFRFERGVAHGCGEAIERATALAIEVCGARPPAHVARGEGRRRVARRTHGKGARAARLRGCRRRDARDFAAALVHPGDGRDGIHVTPPSWRFDLAIEEDFVEEIARVKGYEHVPDHAPRASAPSSG